MPRLSQRLRRGGRFTCGASIGGNASYPGTPSSNQLELAGSARQLANHCALIGRKGGLVKLGFDPKSPIRAHAGPGRQARAGTIEVFW